MAEKDRPDEGPTLELPSFFGRRKRQRPEPEPETESALAVEDQVTEAEVVEAPPDPPPVPAEDAIVVDEPVTAAVDEDLAEPLDEPAQEVLAEPVAEVESAVHEPEPQLEEPETVVSGTEVHEPEPQVDEPETVAPPPAPGEPRLPAHERIQAGLPDLAAGTAAIVVGAVVGLVGCFATYLSLKGCELATGTDSCGGPGLLVLILIVIGMIVVGAALLRLFAVAEPGNLSFLGVAITAAVILVFLIKYLFSVWMFAVVPVLCALAFGVARWVTTRWTDDGEDLKGDWSHDVR